MPVRTAENLQIRQLEPADLDAVADLSAAAFGNDLSEEAARRRWTERLAHPLATDPEGAFRGRARWPAGRRR